MLVMIARLYVTSVVGVPKQAWLLGHSFQFFSLCPSGPQIAKPLAQCSHKELIYVCGGEGYLRIVIT